MLNIIPEQSPYCYHLGNLSFLHQRKFPSFLKRFRFALIVSLIQILSARQNGHDRTLPITISNLPVLLQYLKDVIACQYPRGALEINIFVKWQTCRLDVKR